MEHIGQWQIIGYTTIVFVLFVYTLLDGFDLGLAFLIPFISKDPKNRTTLINSLSPVWDGNEVWLIIAGALLFALFPIVFATALSSLYIPVCLLSLALIFRAISFELFYHSKTSKALWLWMLSITSFLIAAIAVIAVGNSIVGVPIDAHGYFKASIPLLVRPFPLLLTLTAATILCIHGLCYALLKTEVSTALHNKMRTLLKAFSLGATIMAVGMILSLYRIQHPHFFRVWVWIGVLIVVGSLFFQIIKSNTARPFSLMVSSCTLLFGVWTFLYSLHFPNIIVSTNQIHASLTLYSASSSLKTLTFVIPLALISLGPILFITGYMYKVFKGTTTTTSHTGY